MLRDARYKYVLPLIADELEELSDLKTDPRELDNLAIRSEHRKILQRMRARATAELRRTGAGFVDRLPPVRRPS